MKKKQRTFKETLTMWKNQILIKLGFILINKHNYMVMSYAGVQLRTNKNRTRVYSLDDAGWRVVGHSWKMDDEIMLKFLKKDR